MWMSLFFSLLYAVFAVFGLAGFILLVYAFWSFLRPANRRSNRSWRVDYSESVLSEYDEAIGLAADHGVAVAHEDVLRTASDPEQDAVSRVRSLVSPVWFDVPGGSDQAAGVPASCRNGDAVRAWGRVALTLRGRRPVDAVSASEIVRRCGRELAKAISERTDAFDASIRLEALGKQVCDTMDYLDNDSHFHVAGVRVTRVERAD